MSEQQQILHRYIGHYVTVIGVQGAGLVVQATVSDGVLYLYVDYPGIGLLKVLAVRCADTNNLAIWCGEVNDAEDSETA